MNPLISFFRRKILRIPAERWDHQYRQGAWDGLSEESVRLDAVIDLIRSNYHACSILEIGCGQAVMLMRMEQGDFGNYTGMDFSQVAIDSIKPRETANIRFVCADMNDYRPDSKYDVVVFNESLYYAKDPVAVMSRYISCLNPQGCIIVTAFQNRYAGRFWPLLDRNWPSFREVIVGEGDQKWGIRMYLFLQ